MGSKLLNFRQPCPRRKKYKESALSASKLLSCQGRQTLNLPGAPACFRPDLDTCGNDAVKVLVCEVTKLYCVQAFLLRMTHCTCVINSELVNIYHTFSFVSIMFDYKNNQNTFFMVLRIQSIFSILPVVTECYRNFVHKPLEYYKIKHVCVCNVRHLYVQYELFYTDNTDLFHVGINL